MGATPPAGPSGPQRRPPRAAHLVLGAGAEEVVARWYEGQGYTILDRNWRVREGELDLVVARGGVLAFCEVKARTGLGFGAPVEAVTPAKARRIRMLAARWLAANPGRRRDIRFDVASVLWARGTEPVVEVLEGVF